MDRSGADMQDLNQVKLQLAEDVRIWPVRERGSRIYRLEIPALHRFFCIGHAEYVLIAMLDGSRTLPQACGLAASRLGRQSPSGIQSRQIARWLLRNQLAHPVGTYPPDRQQALRGQTSDSDEGQTSAVAKWNPFWLKCPLPMLDHTINRFGLVASVCFHPAAVALGLLTILVAGLSLLFQGEEFLAKSSQLIHPDSLLFLIATWLVLKVVHELAHVAACRRHGIEVTGSGLVFVLFAPLAYVDVSGCWRLMSKWDRIGVSAAGMFVELWIAAIALLLWCVTESALLRHGLEHVIVAASVSTIAFNANVLMRFDGYHLLADLVEIPNLYAEAVQSLQQIVRGWMSGEPSSTNRFTGWRRPFLVVYGLSALVWRIVVCIALAISASTLFAGAGVVIALGGIAMWLLSPLKRFGKFVVEFTRLHPDRRPRACLVFACLVILLLGLFFWVPLPTPARAPAVTRYPGGAIIRARADGFVNHVAAQDGQVVAQGDPLVSLENHELIAKRKRLRWEIEKNELQLRCSIESHDRFKENLLRSDRKALLNQLDQLEQRCAHLIIKAPRNGRVIAENLASLHGTYVREGDIVAVIAEPDEKEVVAWVSQQQIQLARSFLGEPVACSCVSMNEFFGIVDRIEPLATDQLTDRALSASEGGELPVEQLAEQDGSSPLRLLEPHLRTRIRLDANIARELPAGLRVSVKFGVHRETFFQRLDRWVAALLRHARQGS